MQEVDLSAFRHRTIELHIEFLSRLDIRLSKGAKVLDFGCGIGDSVQTLLELGYDAYGVDILEFWGRDIDRWWLEKTPPSPEVARRLFTANENPCRLPFEARCFDFCFSDEVFEHVSNPIECFSEIGRVLKLDAVSLHRFPGPNSLIEGHIGMPIAAFCHWRPWLAIFAAVGVRPHVGKTWTTRETIKGCFDWMQGVHYPPKRALRRYARQAAVEVEFLERRDFATRDIGGMASVSGVLAIVGLGFLARALLPLFAQRYMLLRPIRS